MAAYYNENDPFAAAWLRNLIAAGHIAPGEVDERSIEDVQPADLAGYSQCPFFAGIGVWSHALRNAGWPDDRVVWTGSCPCQPFSAAGKRGGTADERHLWPAFFHLVDQCRPPVVLGEQVASKDGLAWLDLVSADMEGAGYAFGAVDTCAAGFGAPHIRQRLWFVGIHDPAGTRQFASGTRAEGEARDEAWLRGPECGRSGSGLADDDDTRLEGWRQPGCERAAECAAGPGELAGRMADGDGGNTGPEGLQRSGEQRQQQEDGSIVWVGDTVERACEREAGSVSGTETPVGSQGVAVDGDMPVGPEHAGAGMGQRPGPLNGFWRDADWLLCRDGRWRPVEPGTFPLVNGAANRVGLLRGAGNAIVSEQAQGFVEAVMDALGSP